MYAHVLHRYMRNNAQIYPHALHTQSHACKLYAGPGFNPRASNCIRSAGKACCRREIGRLDSRISGAGRWAVEYRGRAGADFIGITGVANEAHFHVHTAHSLSFRHSAHSPCSGNHTACGCNLPEGPLRQTDRQTDGRTD